MVSNSSSVVTSPSDELLPRYLTLDEVAEISRRTPNALRNLRKRGLGPRFRKVDGRLLCHRDDLTAWLAGPDFD